MPVHGMVDYDCNVSLKNQSSMSTTMIVSLPDGMEKHPVALQEALLKSVLGRLKIVVTEIVGAATNSWYDDSHQYSIDISTSFGFRLGSLRLFAPASTGWRNHLIDLRENYFASEMEQYIRRNLQGQVVVRINQRMPPLPRVGVDPSGQREDMVWKLPIDHPDRPNQDERELAKLVYATAASKVQEQRLKDELKRLRFAEMSVDMASVAEEMLARSPLVKKAISDPGQDVGKRTQADRVDVARRGGSYRYDVAQSGMVLDL